MNTHEFRQYLNNINNNFLDTDTELELELQSKLEYIAEDKGDLILERLCEKLEMNKSDDYIVSDFISEMLNGLEFDNLIKMNLLTQDELDTWIANVPMQSDEE